MDKESTRWAVIFIVFVICFTGAFSANIQIIPEKENLLVGLGNKQILECIVTDDKPVNESGFNWTLPQLNTNVAIRNKADGNSTIHSILTISNFTDQHVGVYTCSFKDISGKQIKSTISLASLTESKTDGEFFFGNKSATLICAVDDFPNATFWSWHKDNETLKCDDTLKNTKFTCFKNGTLIITKPTRTDAGIYKALYNMSGEFGSFYECEVFYKAAPLVHNMAKSKNLEIDDQLDLFCEVLGYPEPTVKWLKNGVAIVTNNQTMMSEHKNIENAHLTIKSVKKSDEGKYTCKATNAEGEGSNSIIVRIKDKIEWVWPIIGIICEAIVLGIIITICNKVKNKHLVE